MIEILTVTFKNAVIMGTIEFAFQNVNPVPKTS